MSEAAVIPIRPIVRQTAVDAPPLAEAARSVTTVAASATGKSSKALGLGAQFLSVSAANVCERLVGLVGSMFAFRALGAASVGQINWVTAFTSYFLMVINPGVETIARREVARDNAKAAHYAATILVLELLLSTLAGIVVVAIILSGVREHATNVLLGIQVVMMLLIPFDFTWLLFAREKVAFSSWLNTGLQLAQLPIIVLFIKHPSDVYLFALLAVPARLIYYGAIGFYAIRADLVDWRSVLKSRPFASIPSFIKESIPLGASQVATLIYYNIGLVFLGFWHTNREVGLYSTAYKLMLMQTLLFTAMWSVYFPVLSRLMHKPIEAKSVSIVFLSRLTWLGCLIAAVTWGTGRHVLVLLYGRDYESIGPLYEWLSLNAALIYINCGLILPFTAWGLQRLSFQITAIAAVFNVATNLLLIPRYGAVGATVSAIAAEALVLFLGVWWRRSHYPIPWVRHLMPPVFISLCLAIALRAATSHLPSRWIAIFITGCFASVIAYVIADTDNRRFAIALYHRAHQRVVARRTAGQTL